MIASFSINCIYDLNKMTVDKIEDDYGKNNLEKFFINLYSNRNRRSL